MYVLPGILTKLLHWLRKKFNGRTVLCIKRKLIPRALIYLNSIFRVYVSETMIVYISLSIGNANGLSGRLSPW